VRAARVQVFEGLKNKDGKRNRNAVLTPEEKKRRLVLKRVNLDGAEQRSNFLRAGTMARVSHLVVTPDAPLELFLSTWKLERSVGARAATKVSGHNGAKIGHHQHLFRCQMYGPAPIMRATSALTKWKLTFLQQAAMKDSRRVHGCAGWSADGHSAPPLISRES
jgi:hypothetical protein